MNQDYSTAQDTEWMAEAIRLAKTGLTTTTPNPRVGCVIVKNAQIVGRGAHLKAGEPHAEVYALREAGELARGSTAYVTLEPCSHTGRTPPCAHALIEAGVARVVMAMQDPNPLVSGRGAQQLRAAGIVVTEGVLSSQAQALNLGFIKRMTQGMPYVRLKSAASLDGQTALSNGESQWISAEYARADVQHWRAQSCAVMTGIGTVLADNPALNVRLPNTVRQPLRVILDSQCRLPEHAKILDTGPVLLVYSQAACAEHALETEMKCARLHARGVQTLAIQSHVMASDITEGHPRHRLDIVAVLRHLGQLGINELWVEAGATLSGAMVEARLVDEYVLYLAPKWMGHGRGLFDFQLQHLHEAQSLSIVDVRQIGPDLRICAKPAS